MTHAERQKVLSQIWGFNCTCNLCAGGEAARKASDARRLEFRALRDEVLARAQEGDFAAAIRSTEALFRVTAAEHLAPHIGDLYEMPARLHYQTGDLEAARRYLKLSMHEAEGWGVPGSRDAEKLRVQREVLRRLEAEIAEKARGQRQRQQQK